MESRKVVLMNLFAGKEWRNRHRHSGGRRWWDKLKEYHSRIYTAAAAAKLL